ncbi:MAG TPA: sulfotransferase [Woeseiaceae bacterium]|nr:sulfotransferase [Woeseiaceae bacterium]
MVTEAAQQRGRKAHERALAGARQLIQAARFEEAEAAMLDVLGEAPAPLLEAEARYTLAVARRYAKNYEGALQAADELLALRPEYGRAWQEKGYTWLAMNRPAEAAAAFAHATELNPGLTGSWKALVNLYGNAGREHRARHAQNQVEYLASLPQELLAVIDLIHEGKLYKAEQLCRRFLQQHKQHVEAMRLLADIGVRLKVLDDAEFLLETAVELEPENTRVRIDYLRVLNRKGKFRQALEQACILLEREPDNPIFKLASASALTGLGRFEEGLEQYRECIGRTTNKAGIHVMMGHAFKAIGRLDDAIAAYREATQLRPDYGDAYWSLANTKTYRFGEEEIEEMRRREAEPGVAADDRIHLCFALGKALEDRAEYEESFGYYRRGNALKKERSGYDADKTEAMIRAKIDVCTERLFEQRAGVGCERPDPIFIVGLPRAGSTLLEQILASHSLVDGTMELHDLLGLAQRLRGRTAVDEDRYPRILAELDDDYFRRFGEKFIEDTRVYRGDAPFFTDKMPNNFMHIGLIRLILPNAKVIDARRHPMACCFSGFKQLFGEGQDFTYGLEEIGRYYRDYVRLMDHWDAVLPGFVLRVHHEDVVEDLETQVRRMLDFCGLPFEEACLEFHKTERSVRTPSSEQVRQPIYRSGLEQWRHYEPWLDPLKEALGPDLRGRFGIDQDIDRDRHD